MLTLHCDEHQPLVHNLSLEQLGSTSISESLSYLDNGLVYVGSKFGDSQLIRLLDQAEVDAATAADGGAAEGGAASYIQVVDTITNLGPIVDFAVVDLDRQGQCQVVTCSGAGKDGSLRVVRNGVGMREQASIDMDGVKGLWTLRPKTAALFDQYMVQSFIGETRVLAIDEEGELGKRAPRRFTTPPTHSLMTPPPNERTTPRYPIIPPLATTPPP